MKLSKAALLFLILAAALGPPTLGAPAQDLRMVIKEPDQSILGQAGVHRPGDCCFSYTQRRIRCTNMKDYFLTTSGCSQPGVIFKTSGGREVCFHPSAGGVLECMEKLASEIPREEGWLR